MAAGRKGLRKLQLGWEVTPGTAVATTTIWRGEGVELEDNTPVEEVPEDVGILGGTNRTYIPSQMGKLAINETPATFEQIGILTAAGCGGPITGATDGSGSGRIYNATIPTTTLPTNRALTLEGGDDTEVERAEYCKVAKLKLKGVMNKALMVSGELIARRVQRHAPGFTAAVALPTVEDILMNRGKFYLDVISGTYGTTQVSNQIVGVEIEFEWLWHPQPTMDGNLYFTDALYTGHKAKGKVTFLHDTGTGGVAGASGQKVNWRAQTPRLAQFRWEGSTFAQAGTAYSVKTLIVNLPIKWKKFGKLSESDGVALVEGEFFSKYDTVAGNAGNIIAVNALTALP